jgi:transposase-like protein
MSLFGNGWVQKYYRITEKFVIGTRKVKRIFVDETLLRINGPDYHWLWLAYEPNLNVCLLSSIKRRNYLPLDATVFQTDTSKIWKQVSQSTQMVVLIGIMKKLVNG